MLDKFSDAFNKLDNTLNTADRVQRTTDRIEYHAQNAGAVRKSKWKMIVIGILVVGFIIYLFI